MIFVEKFSAGLSKLHSKCAHESLEDFFLQKSHVLRAILDNEWKFTALSRKFFWQICRNCILSLHGITLMEIIFFHHRVFDSFSNVEQKDISLLTKSFQQACRNGILRVQRNCLRVKKQLFESFETLAKKFWPPARNFSGRSVKSAICVSEWVSWRHFSKKFSLIIRYWA